MKLTETDLKIITTGDLDYILDKGANLYNKGKYDEAIEYYRIASSMGDIQATSNLGYCYLYGRSIEPNIELALAYFTIASNMGNVDASYKLGDIYSSDKWKLKNIEMSNYYYNKAAKYLLGNDFSIENILNNEVLIEYPSLCFALGREMSIDGSLSTNLDLSYIFLKIALIGYEKELDMNHTMYKTPYENTKEYLNKDCYNKSKERLEDLFD